MQNTDVLIELKMRLTILAYMSGQDGTQGRSGGGSGETQCCEKKTWTIKPLEHISSYTVLTVRFNGYNGQKARERWHDRRQRMTQDEIDQYNASRKANKTEDQKQRARSYANDRRASRTDDEIERDRLYERAIDGAI